MDISNLRHTIVPKSDQLNSEQLIGGPVTITVTDVRLGSTDEQPLIVTYEGDDGRPYKPCKTMRKVLIFAWGEDGRAWPGKSMTLFNDPAVRFGGATVGGIRISHMSGIERDICLSLTATKGKKAGHTIKPMITLQEVTRLIETAQNKTALDAAKVAATLLPPAERDQARTVYSARIAAIKAAAQPQAEAAANKDQA
jgi:hypothetical protein